MPLLTHTQMSGQGGVDGEKGHVSEEVVLHNGRACHISTNMCMHTCMSLADDLGSEQSERSSPDRWENWFKMT